MKATNSLKRDPAVDIADVPVATLRELLAELADGAWTEPEGMRLLLALRTDARPAVRSAVAEAVGAAVGTLTVSEATEMLYAMSDDQAPEVRAAVAAALAIWLERAEELWQIVIVEQFAASPMRLTRETLAKALSFPFSSPVADLALELLAQDPVAAVRLEVVSAVRSRLHEDPQGYGELLRQLALDVKGPVRWQARRWLRRLVSSGTELRPVVAAPAAPTNRPAVSLGLSPAFELA
jgi:hypothetical protein